jgi:hypothetical protein
MVAMKRFSLEAIIVVLVVVSFGFPDQFGLDCRGACVSFWHI